jgi:F-type H+-transporting ATPase subunit b
VIIDFTNYPLGEGFGINTNLFETNIINLSVVIGVLVYFGGDILKSLLANRREMILKSITDAEERYADAIAKLNDAKEQLNVANTKAEEIRAQGLVTASKGTANLLARAEEDIKRLEEAKQATIRFEEEKAVNQVCERVSRLALEQAVTKVKKRMDANLQQRVVDLNIALLGKIQ